ncbi:hypothetical protein VIGAN_11152500 [Vigna angularis var. angularis]|uniref:Uncharacterized protein n=1 Tax=Vigna angularis var. angularis TaxID=157739 RepID=A0A0S3TAV1_PHAAN|nr:hypothetical protein VIGAN_11152500 [Vigna angularis var. angularis]
MSGNVGMKTWCLGEEGGAQRRGSRPNYLHSRFQQHDLRWSSKQLQHPAKWRGAHGNDSTLSSLDERVHGQQHPGVVTRPARRSTWHGGRQHQVGFN